MAYDLNQIRLIGKCTTDPEMYDDHNQDNCKYVRFSMVTEQVQPSADGTPDKTIKTVEFHNLICFGKRAGVLNDLIRKNSLLLLDGRVQYNRSQDDTGIKEYTDILIEHFHFIKTCARHINRIELCGNLGKEPEVRFNGNGDKFLKLSVGTNWGNRTDWHKVILAGDLADEFEAVLSKGDQVYVVGQLHKRSWSEKATQKKRFSTEILCNRDFQITNKRHYAGSDVPVKDELDFDKSLEI